MAVITNIEDLRRMYQARVPKMFYDYAESGSWTEQTFRENSSDFDEIYLRQRVAVDMDNRSTKSQLIGQDVSMPVALAPVGLTGMQHFDGEIKAAQAAADFGVPYCLSTMSICSIEDVAENTSAPFWMQVYTLKDDDFMQRLFDRAKDAKCSAAVITVDLQLLGQRHKDLKNGLSAPPKLTPKSVANMMTKVRWGLGMLQTKRRFFGNIVGHASGVTDPSSLSSWTAQAFDQSLDWDRIREFRKMWDGPLIIKGIIDPRDALEACNVGADAIVVSNHGGRQLDGAISSIKALEPIMDAVGDKIEVHLDSGIRSGQDVLKALAMGAKGTWIGRAYVYGLGAMGQEGVTKALEIIHKELDTSMALCGRRDVTKVDRDILYVPKGFSDGWDA
ncbi:MAG: alpha-hydroxy acid oxidase [Pseudomonadota bacterium]|jgi:L-lactate dehydrogenase (cytochrome)|uniref:L-lactate dehydrogenase (Cytochrome) n=1 Tax=Thalassococcus halodurans TaxID=373675 RepID=A0A1H6A2Q9_9RHOB|nr:MULTISPECIES: alpha-hydroxy acid oxidase [Thalassococcus]MBO6867546.1 alpha-hydroxy-acid oxidizing protein [Thalassococcus sp.]MEC8580648.1 alpha-hydroxy acid oxidase [Pseudomonadota bacterium]MEE3361507.1 alpha-hydroxy acid oxidase [Pseudomonadota bacterium]SEG43043.1 L-lactate dehydrogenase (cytochrome) [Thalassococcus halodurans]